MQIVSKIYRRTGTVKAQLLLLAWLLCALASLRAQTERFRHYGLEDGLPSLELYDFLQDQKGYIWLASDHGIARYDGYNFRVWTSKDGLPYNTVFRIYEDPKGRIWTVCMRGGLAYIEGDSLHVPSWNARLCELLGQRAAFSLYWDKQGRLFLTKNALGRGQNKDYQVLCIEDDEEISVLEEWEQKNRDRLDFRVHKSYIYGQKPFMLGGDPYDWNNYAHCSPLFEDSLVREEGDWLYFGDFAAHHLYLGDGEFLAVSTQELFVYNKLGKIGLRRKLDFLGKRQLIHCYLDRNNRLWLATSAGVFALDNWRESNAAQVYLPNYVISRILEDREGHIWFSSIQDGLFFMRENLPELYKPEYATALRSLQSWGDSIWLSLANGDIYLFDKNKKQLWRKLGAREGENLGRVSGVFHIFEQDKEEIFYQRIQSSKGRAWLPKNIVLRAALADSSSSSGLWLASKQGLFRFDASSLKIEPTRFKKSMYFLAYQDREHLLLGDYDRLYRYTIATDSFTELGSEQAAFLVRFTSAQAKGRQGLWLGTRGHGLYHYDYKKKLLSIYTEQEGLSSNLINCLYVQSDTVIWLGSNKGLDRLSFSRGSSEPKIRKYSSENALPCVGIYDILGDSSGLWLASQCGLVHFPFAKSIVSQSLPLYIRGLEINGETQALDSFYRFQSNENNIKVYFSALAYGQSASTYYRYSLEGLDEGVHISQERELRYNNLAPGFYRLHLAVRNSSGQWVESLSKLEFEIVPSLWSRPWFLLLSASSFLLCIAAIFYWQYRRNALLRQIGIAEQKALRAQLNPHFLYNALNSILFFIRKNDKNKASRYLATFSQIIRRVFENSKRDFISLEEELQSLTKYIELEFLRFASTEDSYRIELAQNIDAKNLAIPPMLLQPLIENAILHGLHPLEARSRRLFLRITLLPDKWLCIEVEDNGIGRQASKGIRHRNLEEQQASGLALVRERLQLIQRYHAIQSTLELRDLESNTGQAQGTLVRLCLEQKRM